MKKTMTIVGISALMLGILAGPAAAELLDTGTKNAVIASCEEMGGVWDANGWGNDGDPTCVLASEDEIRDTPGVTLTREGGQTVYKHEDTATHKNSVTAGSWDEGTTTDGGFEIFVKATGKTIRPAGQNK